MLTLTALLLAAATAGPNDWIEFPNGGTFPDTLLYAQVGAAKAEGAGFRVNTINVRRGSYDVLTITVDCTARTVTWPGGPSRLRGSNKENGSTLASTSPIASAGGYGKAAEWLCGGRNPSALAGNRRVSGDPKSAGWKRIDAFYETLPNRLLTEIGKAAPHLTLRMGGVTTAITSGRSDCGFFYFTLADGRSAKLDLTLNAPHRRTRMIGFGGVQIGGFTPDEFAVIDYALQNTPGCG